MAAAFAIGRYTVPKSITTDTHTNIVEKIDTNVKKDETITSTKKPDGTVTTVTVIHSDISSKTKESIKEDTHTKIVANTGSLNIEALASLDITNPTHLVYGAHVSNSLIGPIRVGVFGFTDGKVGLSLGLSF